LLFVERLNPVGEEIWRVAEMAVAQKPKARATHLVRARLGHGIDDHAGCAAVLGVVTVGDNLELLDVLLAVALIRAAAALPTEVHTVDLVLRHIATAKARPNGPGVAAGAWHERDQVEPIAAVERQALDLVSVDASG